MPKEVRTEKVFTRLTKTDREKVNRLADKYNMTVSTYLQHLVRKAR